MARQATDETAMTAAIIYAAKSSPDEKGSTDDQIARAHACIEREANREVAGEFSEQDVSGYRGSRGPKLEAAMQAAVEAAERDGKAELWVFHSSRLARGSGLKAEARSLMEIFTYLRRHGVAIRSVEDDAYVTDEAFIGMASKMANKFSEDLSAHTRRGKRKAAEKGRPHGGIAPYGYRYEGKREDCRLVPDAAEAPVVRRIFESYAAGESQLAILRALNADGIPTKRGAPRWAQGTLVAILRNPLYLGKVRHRGELYDGDHDPLVSAELWARVEALRAAADSRPGRGRGRRPNRPYLFLGGTLKCGACGGPMVPRSDIDRYYCLTRIENGPEACTQGPIPRSTTDRAALTYFEQVGLDVDATREQIQRAIDGKLSELHALKAQAARERLQKTDARARVETDYLAGQITGDTFERLSAKLSEELSALDGQLERLSAREVEIAAEAAASDAEAAMLAYLTEIRAAIVSDVRAAEGIEAIRAALSALFDHFLVIEGGLYPVVRQEAVASYVEDGGYTEVTTTSGTSRTPTRRALPRRIPLAYRGNNYITASATQYLFGPIPIGAEASR